MLPGRSLVRRLIIVSAILAHSAVASQADAVALSANIQAHHLPWGTIVDPVFASSTSSQIVGYTRCGDSAIWSGHYLAAESYRYAVTGSADALKNVQSAIAGLQALIDVTGTDLLARCRIPLNSPFATSILAEENHNGIHTDSATGYYWVGNTSRDQYSGAMFGLVSAYDLVPEPTTHAAAAALVSRMLDFLIGHAWNIVMPDGTISTTFLIRPDQQLAFLQIGNQINPTKYAAAYTSNVVTLAASAAIPIAIEVQSNSSYFKFNLDYINLFSLIRLETNPAINAGYKAAYTILRNTTSSHQNAFFNMIDAGLYGIDTSRDQQTLTYLSAWLTRPSRDFALDLRATYPACGSPDEGCNPVPVAQRPNTDFLWQRDPFLLDGTGDGTVETAGIDYILPFWMARYYGLANSASVVSAANGGVTTASESIVSLYGPGLAATTAQASQLPLPISLGGQSVQVADSTGATFSAPLFYVSPTQINFEMPPGMATGQATVSVGNVSTTARIQATAPSIFTVNQAGTGLVQSTPVTLTASAPTYLSIYGTGVRARSSLTSVTAAIAGIAVPVIYAGPQNVYAGLDQVNISLPYSLKGVGEVDLVLTVDGQTANTVRVNIQ
jgi:uncharacterized protein (TIGR03437 family)